MFKGFDQLPQNVLQRTLAKLSTIEFDAKPKDGRIKTLGCNADKKHLRNNQSDNSSWLNPHGAHVAGMIITYIHKKKNNRIVKNPLQDSKVRSKNHLIAGQLQRKTRKYKRKSRSISDFSSVIFDLVTKCLPVTSNLFGAQITFITAKIIIKIHQKNY